MILLKSSYCVVCNHEKYKTLRTQFSSRDVIWFTAHDPGEYISKVYCSNCGLIYHEDSI